MLERSGKGLKLTKEGELFYAYALEVLHFCDKKTQDLKQVLHHERSTLNIGIPPTAGAMFFYKVIRKFNNQYPNIDLQIEENASKIVVDKVLNRKQDMGVVIEPCINDEIMKYPVLISEAVALVSYNHPLAKKQNISLSDLKNEQFLMISKDYMFHDAVLEKCYEAGFEPNIVFESYQWEWLFEMASDNQGVCILPKPLVDKYQTERVRQIHLIQPEFPWILSIIHRKDVKKTVQMKAFLNLSLKERL